MPAKVALWKRVLFSFLWLPDDRQGFLPAAVREAAPYLRKHRAVIIATAPPFTTLLAGLWLSRRHRYPLVVEFRDPWIGNPWKPGHVRTAMSDGIERWLERRLLRHSRAVVVVSEGLRAIYTARVPRPGPPVVLIRNGIDRVLEPSEWAPADNTVRIVHIGSFYHGRDPRPFLCALAAIRPRLSRPVVVELVGKCRWFAGHSVENEVSRLGLADIVRFHDWVPHEEAQAFIRRAGVLLLLAQNQPDQVPNKLYEYLGTRRPILAFVDAGGESELMLREAGGHFIVTTQDHAEVERILSSALESELAPAGKPAVLNTWTTASQMRDLCRALEALDGMGTAD